MSLSDKSVNLICVEDHLVYGGVYTIISDLLRRNHSKIKLYSIGFNDYFQPGTILDILEAEYMSTEKIGERIKNIIENSL